MLELGDGSIFLSPGQGVGGWRWRRNRFKMYNGLVRLTSADFELDLIDCLKKGNISGAGLDVMNCEPIENNNELINFENVILTPHSLCWTEECFSAIAIEAISSIFNFYSKKPIKNRVV